MSDEKGHILFEKFSVLDTFKKNDGAAVYLAYHRFLGKKILLKILDTTAAANELKISRFQREAKILAKLEHPNIIKVLDFGMYNNFFYLSAEYFESSNLRPAINNNNLPLEVKHSIITQIFKGLDYAHKHGIIHRDIKPENILINEQYEIKISDFGLSLAENDPSVSEENSIAGTPSYMSPEQIEAEKLTFSTDLFSAGIVGYELLTGINPFLGENVNETIRHILNIDYKVLEKDLIKFPPELKEIILQLLRKEPEKRFASSEAVLKKLAPGEKEKPVDNPEHTKSPGSNIFKITLGVSAVALILVLLMLITGQFFNGNGRGKLLEQPVAINSLERTTLSDTGLTESETAAIDTVNAGTLDEPAEENTAMEEVSPEEGTLFIECIPWAHIEINGQRIDTTPISNDISLMPGKHTITLKNPGYPPLQKTVTISEAKKTSLTVNLDNEFGTVVCKIFPWGEVYVDNQYYGQTPLESGIRLLPGEHTISIKNPNYSDFTKNIRISGGKTTIVKYNFADSEGSEKVSNSE